MNYDDEAKKCIKTVDSDSADSDKENCALRTKPEQINKIISFVKGKQ